MAIKNTINSILILLFMSIGINAANAEKNIVVELFTSKDCPHCPRADKFLLNLDEERNNILALAYHTTSWDNKLFSPTIANNRQQGYKTALGLSHTYTPQIIINGITENNGNNRIGIEWSLLTAPKAKLPIYTKIINNELKIKLPTSTVTKKPCDILLVTYDKLHVVKGRKMVNVVRKVEILGQWLGSELSLRMSLKPSKGSKVALLVQEEGSGRIIGVKILNLPAH